MVQGQENRKVNDALRKAGLDPNDPKLSGSLRQTAQGLVAQGYDPADIAIFLGDKDVQRGVFGAADNAAQAISRFSDDDMESILGVGSGASSPPSGYLATMSGELIEEVTVHAHGIDGVTTFAEDVLRPIMGAAATFGEFAERHERLATMAAAGTQIAMMGPAQFVKGTVIDMAVGATIGSSLEGLDTYIQRRASSWIADQWGFKRDEADFLAHGVSFAGQIVLGSPENIVGGAKNISNIVRRDPVKPLETGRYGDLAPRSVKDSLDIDHSPSFASIRAARERDLGRRLRPEEAAALLRDSSAIAIPADLHRSTSRTYGARNSPAQIQSDSINPNVAIDLDRAAYQRELLRRGYTLEQIEESFDRLKKR